MAVLPSHQARPDRARLTVLPSSPLPTSLLQGVGEKLDGAILTAQGLVSWDGTKKEIVKGKDTLIVTGGSGVAAGADGTVTLAGGESTAVPRTLTLKISVPKAHNHKDESKEN